MLKLTNPLVCCPLEFGLKLCAYCAISFHTVAFVVTFWVLLIDSTETFKPELIRGTSFIIFEVILFGTGTVCYCTLVIGISMVRCGRICVYTKRVCVFFNINVFTLRNIPTICCPRWYTMP